MNIPAPIGRQILPPKPCPSISTFAPVPYTPSAKSVRCVNCKFYYLPYTNTASSCRHHHGVFRLSSASVGLGALEQSQWTCCKKLDANISGCCEGPHMEDLETSAKLDAMFDPARNPPQPTLIEKEGTMLRQGRFFKNWAPRFYKLTNGKILCYENEESRNILRNEILLKGGKVTLVRDDKLARVVIKIEDFVNNMTHSVYAESSEETYDWYNTLCAAVEQANNPRVKSQPKKGDGKNDLNNNNGSLYPTSLLEVALDSVDADDQTATTLPSAPPLASSSSTSTSPSTLTTLPPPALIKHKVEVTDTLAGLSLKYNTTAKLIKEVNKMPTNEVYAYSHLWIPHDGVNPVVNHTPPLSDEQIRRRAISVFMRKASINDYDEAEYYLKENGWDALKAAEEYKKDLEWERSNAGRTTFGAGEK